jgi:hypothetical protein
VHCDGESHIDDDLVAHSVWWSYMSAQQSDEFV